MYKATFKLKQHTPIIHFQHGEAGATLRATELKPKLDKFLLALFQSENEDYSEFLIKDSQEPALDYKVRIDIAPGKIYFLPLATRLPTDKSENLKKYIFNQKAIIVELIEPSPFFSNSDKISFRGSEIDENKTKVDELDFAILTDKEVTVSMVTIHQKLSDTIKKHIELFFLITNFGKRQNKGFGSFALNQSHNIAKSKLANLLIINDLEGIYSTELRSPSVSNFFAEIDLLWKMLKAGKNYGEYEKSDLFKYFYHQFPKIRWEKRSIKRMIKLNHPDLFSGLKYDTRKSDHNRILTEEDSSNNEFYIRALLGLAEHNEYGSVNSRDKVMVKISDELSHSQNPRDKEQAIDRFMAPITFKLIDNTVYMFVYRIPQRLAILENGNPRSFVFDLDAKVDRQNYSDRLTTLKVPQNFSVCDFLDSDKVNTQNGRTTGRSVANSYHFERLI
jgi:hypothetical protein